jgi:hypothetical protein
MDDYISSSESDIEEIVDVETIEDRFDQFKQEYMFSDPVSEYCIKNILNVDIDHLIQKSKQLLKNKTTRPFDENEMNDYRHLFFFLIFECEDHYLFHFHELLRLYLHQHGRLIDTTMYYKCNPFTCSKKLYRSKRNAQYC